jgi:hypothetical protein
MAPLATQQDYIIPESVIAAQDHLSKNLIQAISATTLPPKAQVEAFADSYFDRFYHRAPLIDKADLSTEDPSVLVSQAICMVGSLLRHSGPDSPLGDAEHYYGKVKTLLYTNYEPDQRNVLKALCLLSFRNLTPPKVVSLDCSWQWLGMATRLAYQMGLHRESTYAQLPNPGNARRIMWSLFVRSTQYSQIPPINFIDRSRIDIRQRASDDRLLSELQSSTCGCQQYTTLISKMTRRNYLSNMPSSALFSVELWTDMLKRVK